MSSAQWTALAAVVVALIGGGGIAALFKLRPESAQISVSTAQGAVLVADQVMKRLEAERERLEADLADCMQHEREMGELRGLLVEAQSENAVLRARLAER